MARAPDLRWVSAAIVASIRRADNGVRVWNTARSTAQIQGYMFTELTGQEAGLVGLVALCTFENGAMVNQVNGPGRHINQQRKDYRSDRVLNAACRRGLDINDYGHCCHTPDARDRRNRLLREYYPRPRANTEISDGRACSIDIQSGGQNWTYDASTGLTGDFSMVAISRHSRVVGERGIRGSDRITQ